MCSTLQVSQEPRVGTSEGSELEQLTSDEVTNLLGRRISLVPVPTKKGCSWLKYIVEKDEPLDLFEAQAEVRNFLIKALQNNWKLHVSNAA